MKMKTTLLAAVILCATAAGALLAADTQPATASQPATTSQPAALQAIRYQRSGGFVGTNDTIDITPAGEVTVQGKLLGKGTGKLKPEQMAKLAPLFSDWKVLKDTYPAPAGSAGAGGRRSGSGGEPRPDGSHCADGGSAGAGG